MANSKCLGTWHCDKHTGKRDMAIPVPKMVGSFYHCGSQNHAVPHMENPFVLEMPRGKVITKVIPNHGLT
jgi:hypothetical protein